MMTQSTTESLFRYDPFFDQARMLWPLRGSLALSGLREDFLRRRAQMVASLQSELRDGLHADLFKSMEKLCSSSLARLTDPSSELKGRDLELTLDTQGFSPKDVTVTLSGRRLEVMAPKRAEASSASSSSSASTSDSKQRGFVQTLDLPEHLDLAALTCSLGEDGLLRIEAPETQKASTEERIVPIRYRTSLNVPITKDRQKEASPDKST